MQRIITKNSVYILDDENSRYMRLAKEDRVVDERNPQGSWRLEDGEWLPLREAHKERDLVNKCWRLRIHTPDSVMGILTSRIVEEDEVN